jgi:hypothetical protein
MKRFGDCLTRLIELHSARSAAQAFGTRLVAGALLAHAAHAVLVIIGLAARHSSEGNVGTVYQLVWSIKYV